MADVPKKVTRTITRHEWHIGDEYSEFMLARTLRDGIFFAQKEMESIGIDVTYDDAYKVRAGDGGEIIIYVDVEDD